MCVFVAACIPLKSRLNPMKPLGVLKCCNKTELHKVGVPFDDADVKLVTIFGEMILDIVEAPRCPSTSLAGTSSAGRRSSKNTADAEASPNASFPGASFPQALPQGDDAPPQGTGVNASQHAVLAQADMISQGR